MSEMKLAMIIAFSVYITNFIIAMLWVSEDIRKRQKWGKTFHHLAGWVIALIICFTQLLEAQ
jgi:hypothetical protein